MSNCKWLFFLSALLAVFMAVQTQGRELCQRPANSFENTKHFYEYLKCIKSQVSTTRYGKRAHPPVLGKLRPDLYNDYEIYVQQLYDRLYGENN